MVQSSRDCVPQHVNTAVMAVAGRLWPADGALRTLTDQKQPAHGRPHWGPGPGATSPALSFPVGYIWSASCVLDNCHKGRWRSGEVGSAAVGLSPGSTLPWSSSFPSRAGHGGGGMEQMPRDKSCCDSWGTHGTLQSLGALVRCLAARLSHRQSDQGASDLATEPDTPRNPHPGPYPSVILAPACPSPARQKGHPGESPAALG